MQPQQKQTSKDFLRFESAIYGLRDPDTDPREGALQKLMQEKKKPKFQLPKQSSLLKQVKSFIPIIKKENAKLLNQPVQPLDINLEKQSSSQSSDNQQQQKQQTMQEQVPNQLNSSKSKHIEMNLLLIKPNIEQEIDI